MTGEVHLDDEKLGLMCFLTLPIHQNQAISDGCGESSVPSTVVRGYELYKFGGHLGQPLNILINDKNRSRAEYGYFEYRIDGQQKSSALV